MTRKRKFLWVVVAALVLYIGYTLLRSPAVSKRLELFAAYASGRAVGCSLSDSLNVINDELAARSAAISRHSKILESEENHLFVSTPYGDFWTPSGTDVAFLLAEQEIDLYRTEDPEQGIRPGDVVLDCGANIGTFVRKALTAGASHVVAIEISPRNIQALERTFAEDIEAGRVTIVPEGVWHEDSTLRLTVFENSALDSVVMHDRVEQAEGAHLVDVPLTTIDAIVERLALERVDFIKMDVEGAERNALRGAANVLKTFRPRLAIAAENLPDDVSEAPLVVADAVGDYEVEAGECRLLSPFLIRPEVLHFY